MSSYAAQRRSGVLVSRHNLRAAFHQIITRYPVSRGALFGAIIVGGLIGFEAFNYSTTEFALTDLLGSQHFAGLRWATILALAFCAIDFAGIARLLTPERGRQEPAEVWYLLGAWFLAATMNAMLTWWGVSLSLLSHQGLGNEILGREALLNGVPVFVAALVWLIRVLMIGTLTLAGRRLFSQDESRRPAHVHRLPESAHVRGNTAVPPIMPSVPRRVHAAPKSAVAGDATAQQRPIASRPVLRR